MSDPMVGATTAVLGVHLSVAVTETVNVAWETMNGTAIAGVDYLASNGTVTFAPGETEKQIEVVVYGADVGVNSSKNFYIKLHPPSNAVLFTAFADCTITVVDDGGVAVTKLVVAQGKRGLKGDPGLSAYEQAVLMGFEGTIEEWLNETILDSRVKTWTGRTQEEKNKDQLNIKDYGAKVDGVTVDNVAVATMQSVHGFIRFPRGVTKLTSTTLSGTVYFDAGASLLLDNGQTLTVTAAINAHPQQTIFSLTGTYNLTHDNISLESYEDVRRVQATWFGLYPSGQLAVDQAPLMQRISDALGNSREGVVEFMMGNYQMHSPVLWNRGIEVRGAGTRRTVFKIHGDGYIPFTTNNVAVRFRGFQFEYHIPTMASRNSALLQIDHNDCEIHDVGVYPSAKCIVINGLNAVLRDIRVIFGTDMSSVANSCVIQVQKGNTSIDGVRALTSQFAPQNLILIQPNANTGSVNISNISSIIPCTTIKLLTDSSYRLSNINISNVFYGNSSGGTITGVIEIQSSTNTAARIRGVNIANVLSNGTTTDTIIMTAQNADIDSVNITNVMDQRNTGYIVNMLRSSGVIRGIQIGNLAAPNLTQLVLASDVSVQYKLSNVSEKDNQNPKTWEFLVDNNAVVTIPLFRNVQTASIEVIANSGAVLEYITAAARFINTPAVAIMSQSTNTAAMFNTSLTGTTGVSGRITIAVNDHALQIENRTGSAQNIIATIKSGRW